MNINLVKDRLDRTNGKEYWRSLEEFSRTGEFEEWLKEEFPQHVAVWSESFDRRRFLQLIGASLAISGLGACTRQPAESITPYIRQPEGMVPGNPLFYATAMTLGGFASGILDPIRSPPGSAGEAAKV